MTDMTNPSIHSFPVPKLEYPNLKNAFKEQSVVFIKNLIDPATCDAALSYFLEHESKIITKYQDNRTGLVVETQDGNQSIKYFEYPLSESFRVYGPFANSNVFKLATSLLGQECFLRSMEIHTRGFMSSRIPYHQDNGYYGHVTPSALTFYIPLNSQSSANGGLSYIPTANGVEYTHTLSDAKAFSLEIPESSLPSDLTPLEFDYSPGDASIHHPHSIHFAKPIDLPIERSVVVRLSFFTTDYVVRDGHIQWHQELLAQNRSL